MAIDITSSFTQDPPHLDFIWPGFLSGTVGALIAPGASSKSFWALEAAMSITCNIPGGDLIQLNPKKTGKVVYLAAEDPPSAIIRRIYSIGKYIPKEAQLEIAKHLTVEPILGKRLNIMNEKHLQKLISLYAGYRLIILDTLSRVHQLDENSNGAMAHLISTLEYLATSTGAAILYLHHANKGSSRENQTDQQHAARGASALIDNARWCSYVSRMTSEEAKFMAELRQAVVRQPITEEQRRFFIRFGISKQNYDVSPLDIWYKREEGGVLIPKKLIHLKNNIEIQYEQAPY